MIKLDIIKLGNLYKRYQGALLALTASGIIGLSLNWHLIKELGRFKFGLASLLYAFIIFFSFQLVKRLYLLIVKRLKLHNYWAKDFYAFLDPLLLVVASWFPLVLSTNELFSLLMASASLWLLYESLNHFLASHPRSSDWRALNKAWFLLGGFVWLSACLFQYYAFNNYFFEIKYAGSLINYNVALRSLEITLFWLAGLALLSLLSLILKLKLSYFWLSLWSVVLAVSLFISTFNLGLLRWSGLNLNPAMFSYAKGSGELFKNSFVIILIVLLLDLFLIGYQIIAQTKIYIRQTPKKYWYFYSLVFLFLAILLSTILPVYKNTPEWLIGQAIYQYYLPAKNTGTLDKDIIDKLGKFGLNFNYNQSFPQRDKVYANQSFLPDKFSKQAPNIIIIFLESFSSRLTGVYNKDLADLTPNLVVMSADPDTTVFENFYNASTPTVNGITAELCSFLAPTAQSGIVKNQAIRHNTPCLPDILKKFGNYQSSYLTSVAKNYSNKGEVITEMGTDEILGTEELSKLIKGAPLSWGYSDHQTFPLLLAMAKTKTNPFLLMLSTVDMHPPYNTAQDKTIYGDGKSDLLNAIHTTDDAFGKFWQDFKNSPLAQNTIVVTVADHAIFPAAYTGELGQKLLADIPDHKITFYDENLLMIYVPDTTLPKTIETYSSSLDLTPTLLQILGLNIPNFFEGLSILDNRQDFPNLLGMNEYELYINQIGADGSRYVQYGPPGSVTAQTPTKNLRPDGLSLFEYLQYYNWKKGLFSN